MHSFDKIYLLSDCSPPGMVVGWEDSRVNSRCLREEPKGCPWDKDQSVENKPGTVSSRWVCDLTSSYENTKITTNCWKTITKKMLEPTKKDTLQSYKSDFIVVRSNIFFDLHNFISTSRSLKPLDFHYFSFFPNGKKKKHNNLLQCIKS